MAIHLQAQTKLKCHRNPLITLFSLLSNFVHKSSNSSSLVLAKIWPAYSTPHSSFLSFISFLSLFSPSLPRLLSVSCFLSLKISTLSLCFLKNPQDKLTTLFHFDHLGSALPRARKNLSQFQGFSEVEPPKIQVEELKLWI